MAAIGEEIAGQQRLEQAAMWRRGGQAGGAVGADAGIPAAGGDGPRGGVERVGQDSEGVGGEPVVAVEEQEGAGGSGLADPAIARGGNAFVVLANERDAAIGDPGGDRGGCVGGAVIDDNKRPVAVSLIYHRLERVAQKGRDIECGDNNGDPHDRLLPAGEKAVVRPG